MDGRTEYRLSITVSFGDWAGGSTSPFIPFKTVEIDLSQYNRIFSINCRTKSGQYNDRFSVKVVGMTSNKHYLIGLFGTTTWVNAFSDAYVNLDIIAQ